MRNAKMPIVEAVAVAVATAAKREAGGEVIAAFTACMTVAMNSADAVKLTLRARLTDRADEVDGRKLS